MSASPSTTSAKPAPPDARPPGVFDRLLSMLSSARITTTLLTLGLLLVFVGTLAQTKLGVWVVIHEYFRSGWVWVPVNMFPDLLFPDDKWRYDRGVFFPLPGGFTILALLSVNIFAAMLRLILRDLKIGRGRWRGHLGVYTIHLGLVVMFGGEFVTGLYSIEGQMTVREGAWSNYAEDIRETELAFVKHTKTAQGQDREKQFHVAIPQALLARRASQGHGPPAIDHADLPVLVKIEQYMPNSSLFDSETPTDFAGAGAAVQVHETPAVSAIEQNAVDIPSAVVTLLNRKTGQVLGHWLCSALSMPDGLATFSGSAVPGVFRPQAFGTGADHETWTLHLRYARRYFPYRVELVGLDHDVYAGTQMARNFSSDVRVVDAATDAQRSEHIMMNHPMRHRGNTFYQHQMMAGLGVSVFQVVYNPGSWLPYISCVIVTLGLGVQFLSSLLHFTRRTAR